jgi:hypothetical protein
MNIIKHQEYFAPVDHVKAPIHVIGVGAIGSTVCELLTRLGIDTLNIYDFDTVTDYNIANQMFQHNQIGMDKVDAVEANCKAINPDINIIKFPKGYSNQMLSGHIFLCVDSIELRKQIVTSLLYQNNITSINDFRMRLTDAQYYCATDNLQSKQNLLATMDFTDEEAKAATPLSACGTTLSLVPTVRTIVNLGIANWMQLCKTGSFKAKLILANPYEGIIDFLG